MCVVWGDGEQGLYLGAQRLNEAKDSDLHKAKSSMIAPHQMLKLGARSHINSGPYEPQKAMETCGRLQMATHGHGRPWKAQLAHPAGRRPQHTPSRAPTAAVFA